MKKKVKYVKFLNNDHEEIIFFSECVKHHHFKSFEPISAGFAQFNGESVTCYGESVSLRLQTESNDTFVATKQVFGWEAAEKTTSFATNC